MNSALISALSFATFWLVFVHIGISAASLNPFKTNPTLERLELSVSVFRSSFDQIIHDFELAIASGGNGKTLLALQSHIQERVLNGSALLVDINDEVQNMEQNVFLNRLWVDVARIEVESFLRSLRQILLEVTAVQQKVVPQFTRYVHSDTISVVHLLMRDKIFHLTRALNETDYLLQDAYYHNKKSTVFTNHTKQEFSAHFAQIQANLTVARNETASEYYREVEVLRLSGQVLAIGQQTQVDLELDLFNYMAEFVHKYEQLFF